MRPEARREYVKAQDYDQLRFRTSGEFNRLIIQMEDNTTVGVADIVPPVDPADTLGQIVEHFVEGKWGWVEAPYHHGRVDNYIR